VRTGSIAIESSGLYAGCCQGKKKRAPHSNPEKREKRSLTTEEGKKEEEHSGVAVKKGGRARTILRYPEAGKEKRRNNLESRKTLCSKKNHFMVIWTRKKELFLREKPRGGHLTEELGHGMKKLTELQLRKEASPFAP